MLITSCKPVRCPFPQVLQRQDLARQLTISCDMSEESATFACNQTSEVLHQTVVELRRRHLLYISNTFLSKGIPGRNIPLSVCVCVSIRPHQDKVKSLNIQSILRTQFFRSRSQQQCDNTLIILSRNRAPGRANIQQFCCYRGL